MPVDWTNLHGDAFRGVPVMVVGGAGFIGSHVAEALAELGADVAVYDDLSEGNPANLPAEVKLHCGSILDEPALRAAMVGRKLVFHLAALVSVPKSVTDPVGYHDVNATGTLRVLEAARYSNVRRVMYSASSSAYGDAPELPKVETMAPAPKSPYAASKLAGELLIRSYAACYAPDAVSLRYFNIFGPRQSATSAYAGVVAAFATRLLRGEAPAIYGDGSASRDFTFVENAVHANLLGARREQPFVGDVINIGTGERRTVKELAETMARLAGREDLPPRFLPPRDGDVAHSLASLAKANAVLGYSPVVSFEQGLAQTLEWYRTLG